VSHRTLVEEVQEVRKIQKVQLHLHLLLKWQIGIIELQKDLQKDLKNQRRLDQNQDRLLGRYTGIKKEKGTKPETDND
jgi:hypothetical protein